MAELVVLVLGPVMVAMALMDSMARKVLLGAKVATEKMDVTGPMVTMV